MIGLKSRHWDRLLIVVCLTIVVVILFPHIREIRTRARETDVKRNCRIVQFAVEEFARRNQGVYPATADDLTSDGLALMDLLPGGAGLINPFTHLCSEPVFGPVSSRGQTGYRPIFSHDIPLAYVITGRGGTDHDCLCVLTGRSSPRSVTALRSVSLSPDPH